MNYKIEITEFKNSEATYFRDLNLAWLQKYFFVEAIDEEVLSDPKTYILAKGGHIFFAKIAEEVVGCFALMKANEDIYELSKMAVSEDHQGKKIGNQMLKHCLIKAKELGAKKVILYSNRVLEPAIHLYRKFGFVEVPISNSEYKRSNIKMEKEIQ